MKKKKYPVLLVLLLCFLCSLSAFAAGGPRLVDEANVLTSQEAASICQKLDEVSERLQFDLVIVVKESLDGLAVETAAGNIYDANGYGYGEERDGAILLISMQERDWTITVTGFGRTALNDQAKKDIGNAIVSDLSAGEYAGAFAVFAEKCDEIVTLAKSGGTYKKPYSLGKNLLIGLVISFVVGLIVTSSLAGQLRSVRRQAEAAAYIRKNSLKLTSSSQRFLYRKVDRTQKAQNNAAKPAAEASVHNSTSGKF